MCYILSWTSGNALEILPGEKAQEGRSIAIMLTLLICTEALANWIKNIKGPVKMKREK